MSQIKFDEKKEDIMNAINNRGNALGISEPVTLIDGFGSLPVNKEVGGGTILGGPSIPTVMLIGNNSGRIYHLALKVLLPDIKL